MYRIIFYKDVHGVEPVNEYIEFLEKQNTKDARIRKAKKEFADFKERWNSNGND